MLQRPSCPARTLTVAGAERSACPNARDGRWMGPTQYPDDPSSLANYATAYADEFPTQVLMYELDMMGSKMPMRSTHRLVQKGPRVCQPTRLPLHRQRPLLRLPLQRQCAHRSLQLPMQRRAVPSYMAL